MRYEHYNSILQDPTNISSQYSLQTDTESVVVFFCNVPGLCFCCCCYYYGYSHKKQKKRVESTRVHIFLHAVCAKTAAVYIFSLPRCSLEGRMGVCVCVESTRHIESSTLCSERVGSKSPQELFFCMQYFFTIHHSILLCVSCVYKVQCH